MKKIIRVSVLILLCGMLVILSGGLALSLYYRNNFPVNTWLNGVYCTGKTMEEVNAELTAQTKLHDITVTDKDGGKWQIKAADIELKADYTEALKAYLRQNSGAMWMDNLQSPVREQLTDIEYSWSREKLAEVFAGFDFVKTDADREEGCLVRFDTENGYFLYDGNAARLNEEKALAYIQDCLEKGMTDADLRSGDCYETPQDSAEDMAQRQLWRQLDSFFEDCKLTLDMGAEQIPMSPAILSSFLKTDDGGQLVLNEAGELVVDRELVEQWVDKLAESYNTCDTVKEFEATRGDVISVKYSTYGTELDVKAEKKYLVEAIEQKRTEPEIHVPKYKQEGFVRGLDDIGDTYIEVDMTEQRMYYYVDGELVIETDIVTGCTGKRWGTPEGINFVYRKQRNRVLRGADYATPVDYWMPVKGSVGIHDADWRKEFGGEIYKKNGSHGCINTPPDIMAELYDMVEVGTPVIMFY